MSIYDHLEFKHFKYIVAIAEADTFTGDAGGQVQSEILRSPRVAGRAEPASPAAPGCGCPGPRSTDPQEQHKEEHTDNRGDHLKGDTNRMRDESKEQFFANGTAK
jgi:hypothetical protein